MTASGTKPEPEPQPERKQPADVLPFPVTRTGIDGANGLPLPIPCAEGNQLLKGEEEPETVHPAVTPATAMKVIAKPEPEAERRRTALVPLPFRILDNQQL